MQKSGRSACPGRKGLPPESGAQSPVPAERYCAARSRERFKEQGRHVGEQPEIRIVVFWFMPWSAVM